MKIVSDLQVRRGAARDQFILDALFSPSGDELLSLNREQARRLAEDLLDVGGFEVEAEPDPEPEAA